MRTAEQIAQLMATDAITPEIQLSQTQFRIQLVRSWGIVDGLRVLEIGCGQGDTTAVLAEVVGASGRVVAVDIAEPSYGAPVTVGDSAKRLTNGPLGDRIEFHYGFDVLDSLNEFANDGFDAIVMAHCTWYFDSFDRLRETLVRIRPWGKRLCLSEWDLEPQTIDQLAHHLAVLIQGQVEAYKVTSYSNVRTPYSKESLRSLLRDTGWSIESEATVDAAELADARWEIDASLANSLKEAAELEMPARTQELLRSQVELLKAIAKKRRPAPLPSYSMVAHRQVV